MPVPSGSERKSINMPVGLIQEIEKRVGEKSQKFSEQVCSNLTMFYAVLGEVQKSMQGRFTLAEIKAVCEVMRGTSIEPERVRLLPQILSLNLADAQSNSNIAEKYSFDFQKLELKSHQVTVIEAVWLWDRLNIFWSNPSLQTDENILKIFSAIL
ncbi:MAG: hypothetical protein AB1847_22425 [bacterium]